MSMPITTIEILEQLKLTLTNPHTGKPASDGEVARVLGLGSGAVSTYRTGRSTLGDDSAIRAASVLGLDPEYVVACMDLERAQRAQNVRVAEVRARIAKRFAATVILGVTLALPFPGAPGAAIASEGGETGLHIM